MVQSRLYFDIDVNVASGDMNESFYQYENDVRTDYHHSTEQDYDDLFNAEFTKAKDTESLTNLIPYLVLKCIFALGFRIGCILIEVGSIPVENIYLIILYNLIEISVGVLSYGLIGNRLAFSSKSASGWVSLNEWKVDDILSIFQSLNGALTGFCCVLIATGQMSSFLVGRTRLVSGMILTVFYCAAFQPFLIHWVWNDQGWMRHSNFLNSDVSVKDHAGALVLHIPSVIFGAIGSLFLGRRILKLKDVDQLSFGTENVVITVTGYFLIILNYVIFALPSSTCELKDLPQDCSAIIFTNSFLAIGGGISTVTVLQRIIFREIFRHRRLIRSVQGGVAGLMSVATAVDIYHPSVTIIISLVSSIIFFFVAEVIHNTALEDPCSFISTHLVCGFMGVILWFLVSRTENALVLMNPGVNVLWQFICALAIIGLSITFALLIFLLLKVLGILRNNFEAINHKRAIVLRDTLPKRVLLERLFGINSTTDYVVPGYRKTYFPVDRVTETGKSVTVAETSFSDGNKVKQNIAVEYGKAQNKGFSNTIMQVNTEQMPGKLDIDWRPTCGSGDYYEPCTQIKTIFDPKQPAEKNSPSSRISWEECTTKI